MSFARRRRDAIVGLFKISKARIKHERKPLNASKEDSLCKDVSLRGYCAIAGHFVQPAYRTDRHDKTSIGTHSKVPVRRTFDLLLTTYD